MKFSFAIAALFAVVSIDSASAIQMTAEPVMKKEAPKQTEEEKAAVDAKFAKIAADSKEREEKAIEGETKKMNEAEAKSDEDKAAYRTAYWGHMKDQSDETKRIEDLRVRPAESKPMDGHVAGTETSSSEHWASNMPDHILDNKKGPTAPFDSPAPKATAGEESDAAKDEEKADSKKKTEAAAIGAKSATAAAAPAEAAAAPVAAAQIAKKA
jgi:hypothetical protein